MALYVWKLGPRSSGRKCVVRRIAPSLSDLHERLVLTANDHFCAATANIDKERLLVP